MAVREPQMPVLRHKAQSIDGLLNRCRAGRKRSCWNVDKVESHLVVGQFMDVLEG